MSKLGKNGGFANCSRSCKGSEDKRSWETLLRIDEGKRFKTTNTPNKTFLLENTISPSPECSA